MYNPERRKCRKEQKYSTFSATLLDEIYRSIDGGLDENPNDGSKKYTETNRLSLKGDVDGFFKKARFVESWMEQKGNDARNVRPKGCNRPLSSLLLSSYNDKSDPFFFSSDSSESSSNGLSSETDLFSTKTSCFNTPRLKQVKTTTTTGLEKSRNSSSRGDVDLMMGIKSKSAALKMYANLKKTKTPVSPGARLTNFLNSIFATSGKGRASPLAAAQTASPPASRSCLNKTPRMNKSGSKRTVRFDPVGVIVGDDCRPCRHKRIYSRESPAPENQESKKSQAAFSGDIALKSHHHHQHHRNHYSIWKNESWMNAREEEEEEEEGYEDDLSDSSSDLFEIDLRALVGKRRFREELPVYETTHLDSSRIVVC